MNLQLDLKKRNSIQIYCIFCIRNLLSMNQPLARCFAPGITVYAIWHTVYHYTINSPSLHLSLIETLTHSPNLTPVLTPFNPLTHTPYPTRPVLTPVLTSPDPYKNSPQTSIDFTEIKNPVKLIIRTCNTNNSKDYLYR